MSDNSNSPILPNPSPPTGTIDITEIVDQMASTFAEWSTRITMAALISAPYVGWFFALPILSVVWSTIIHWIMTYLCKTGEMLAFFGNTAIRKASQANDFMDAKLKLVGLPPTVSDEEYENAEKLSMSAFHNLVVLGD